MAKDVLQEYLDDQPPLICLADWTANQNAVWGVGSVVIKEVRIGFLLRMLTALVPGGINIDTLKDRVHDSHKKGLKKLGDLAVPYEIIDEIRARTVRFGLIEREKVFRNAIVQRRTNPKDSLRVSLAEAGNQGDAEKVANLLNLLKGLNERLLLAGAFPMDVHPSNYTIDPERNSLLLQDIGAVLFRREDAKAFASSRGAGRLATAFGDRYRGLVGKTWENPRVKSALRLLTESFENMLRPNSLNQMGLMSSSARRIPADAVSRLITNPE